MVKTLSSIFILLFVASVNAQEPEYMELVKAEAALEDLFTQLYADTLSKPQPILERIQEIMPEALAISGSMEYPWSKLNRIGVIPSGDDKMKFFTWHVMDDLDHYRYFGYIQVGLKKGQVSVYELVDNHKEQRNVQKLQQSTENWYGKLYYKVIIRKYKRKFFYTVLGMDFNNRRSTIKTIEAVTLQRHKPQFVRELFFDGRDLVDRMVLEYSSQVAMSVRYDPGVQMITLDHLVPFHPIYNGNYEFYGPEGSYDGFEFDAGTWIFREDIDARNLD
jgi:hypothetical protein